MVDLYVRVDGEVDTKIIFDILMVCARCQLYPQEKCLTLEDTKFLSFKGFMHSITQILIDELEKMQPQQNLALYLHKHYSTIEIMCF